MHDADYITLHQSATLVPGGTSANCIWRWCRKGVRSRNGDRIRLQHVRIGGKLYTKTEWMKEFWRLLAEADADYFRLDRKPSVAILEAPTRTEQRRQSAVERAKRELAEMGV